MSPWKYVPQAGDNKKRRVSGLSLLGEALKLTTYDRDMASVEEHDKRDLEMWSERLYRTHKKFESTRLLIFQLSLDLYSR